MNVYKALAAGQLKDIFPYDTNDPQTWRQRMHWLDRGFSRPAPGFYRWLGEYNAKLGCSPAALQNVELMANGAPVVIAGQQAGLLTGPVYTVYKAVTAIARAGQLSSILKRPVVPVFWLASEDHDFVEIRSAWFPAGAKLAEIRYPGEYTLTPAAGIPLEQTAVDTVISGVEELLPSTQFTGEIGELLRQTAAAVDNFSDWCGALLSQLLSGHGLVVLDASALQVRQLSRPVFQLALSRHGEIHRRLDCQGEKLRRAGSQPGLELESTHSLLFYIKDGQRLALLVDGSSFRDRQGKVSLTSCQLAAAIEQQPETLSPNVVLRPLVQELVLPVLAMVVGPGEAAYMAQVAPVFSMLEQEAPPLVPRLGGVLIEPALARLLARHRLTVAAVERGLDSWLEQQLALADPMGISQSFAQLKQNVGRLYAELSHGLAQLDKQLPQLAEKNLKRVLSEVDWLRKRAEAAHNRNNKLLHSHVARLRHGLAPAGGQERVHNVFWYLNKFGPGLLDSLLGQQQGPDQIMWL